MRKSILASLLLLALQSVRADVALPSLLNASVGTWEGELYYLDYQSGQRFGIPMRVDADVTPDGATLVRRLTFTDPGNLVHAINLVTIDRDSGEMVEAYFREGKGELLRYQVIGVEYANDEEWRIVYEQDGRDDNRPARIRHTISRDGEEMTSSKQVRFLDEDEGRLVLRNGTRLTLTVAD